MRWSKDVSLGEEEEAADEEPSGGELLLLLPASPSLTALVCAAPTADRPNTGDEKVVEAEAAYPPPIIAKPPAAASEAPRGGRGDGEAEGPLLTVDPLAPLCPPPVALLLVTKVEKALPKAPPLLPAPLACSECSPKSPLSAVGAADWLEAAKCCLTILLAGPPSPEGLRAASLL